MAKKDKIAKQKEEENTSSEEGHQEMIPDEIQRRFQRKIEVVFLA